MKKDLIIQIAHGGLGDHLFYSHIPRIAKESGAYERVYISNHSDFRNKDYKKLVWEHNPFIDGFSDEPGQSAPPDLKISDGINLLDAIMLSLGLDDGKRHHEPEIYYKPRVIEALRDKTIYDPNYISNAGFVSASKVTEYFDQQNVKIDSQMKILGERAIPVLRFDEFIKCETFWDFIDVIYSAKEVYCLVTGTATLAPALGKKANVFFTIDQEPIFRHSPNNKYIQL